jgi:prefoldin subunit 5
MYLGAKIQAHIKLLEQRKAKISFYLEQVTNSLPTNPLHVGSADRKRVSDIEQSIQRITNQITQYQAKLDKINSLTQ